VETALDNGYDMKIAIETLVVPTFTLPNYLPANSSAAQMRHLEKRIDKISKKNNDIGGKYECPIPLYGISIGCSEAQDTSARNSLDCWWLCGIKPSNFSHKKTRTKQGVVFATKC